MESRVPEEQELFFQSYCRFFREFGYDTVSYECCIGGIMPGSGCLGNSRHPASITCPEDFEAYPWEEIPERFFAAFGAKFEALRRICSKA